MQYTKFNNCKSILKNDKKYVMILSKKMKSFIKKVFIYIFFTIFLLTIFVDDFPQVLFRKKVPPVIYIVESGDTLDGVADKYDVTPLDIIAFNDLKSIKSIKPGQRLGIKIDMSYQDKAIFLANIENRSAIEKDKLERRKSNLEFLNEKIKKIKKEIDNLNLEIKFPNAGMTLAELRIRFDKKIDEYNSMVKKYKQKQNKYNESVKNLNISVDEYNYLMKFLPQDKKDDIQTENFYDPKKNMKNKLEILTIKLKDLRTLLDELEVELKYPDSGYVTNYDMQQFDSKVKEYKKTEKEYNTLYSEYKKKYVVGEK